MKARIYAFLLFLTFGTAVSYRAQSHLIDSLKQVLSSLPEDTNRVKTLNKLSWQYKNIARYREALAHGTEAVDLSRKLNFTRGLADSHNRSGLACLHMGTYPDALKHFLEALKNYTKKGDTYNVAGCHILIGIVYWFQHNFPSAREHYFEALRAYQDIKNRKGVADSYGNIGVIYYDEAKEAAGKRDIPVATEKFQMALSYYTKVLEVYQEFAQADPTNVVHKQSIAGSFNNIGNVYAGMAKLYAEAGNTKQIAAYRDSVISMYQRGLALFESYGDKQGMAGSYNNMANTYREFGLPGKAKEYSRSGLVLAQEVGSKDDIKTSYYCLYQSSVALNDHKNAFTYYKQYILYSDSLVNEENTKKTVQAEMQYEFDKKEAATKLEQEKKEAVAAAEARKQRIILLAISGFGLFVLGFAVFAYRSFLQKRKANVEISRQKHLIEEKQKEILDSIHYAKRIQKSLMAPESYIEKSLARLYII